MIDGGDTDSENNKDFEENTSQEALEARNNRRESNSSVELQDITVAWYGWINEDRKTLLKPDKKKGVFTLNATQLRDSSPKTSKSIKKDMKVV